MLPETVLTNGALWVGLCYAETCYGTFSFCWVGDGSRIIACSLLGTKVLFRYFFIAKIVISLDTDISFSNQFQAYDALVLRSAEGVHPLGRYYIRKR